jgi:hypothetical protein
LNEKGLTLVKRIILTTFLVFGLAVLAGCGAGEKPPPPQAGKEINLPTPKGSKVKQGPAVEKFDTVPPPPDSHRKQ